MIFTVDPEYRNCQACGKKVPYYDGDCAMAAWNKLNGNPATHCSNCGATFPVKESLIIQRLIATCKRRLEHPDNEAIFYSVFTSHDERWNSSYAIPLYSINELLTVINLMDKIHQMENEERIITGIQPMRGFIGGFRPHEREALLCWHPLLWDYAREIFLAGDDQGPRSIRITSME